MGSIDFAIVHHANQYLVTNGYRNREGLDDVIGIQNGDTGYLKIFQLHRAYRIPFNLHLSGTLLEAILWHCPDFLLHLRDLRRQGLVDFIGSSYGQNIMRFFADGHNFRQLDEGLELYRRHLGVEPRDLRVFWPPERVWDTKKLAPLITDKKLLNRGYKYILADDRLFHPIKNGSIGRDAFDRGRKQSLTDFYPCRISRGKGLTVLPISFFLRRNIPPHGRGGLEILEERFHWLAEGNSRAECNPIAIYGDDLEKSAGCCGWDEGSPKRYENFLKWLGRNPWVRPVKLNEWSGRCDSYRKPIEVGTYYEMSRLFGAGEDYEKWYYDPRWARYRNYYAWSEKKVSEVDARGANAALSKMAWKHLLASGWETGWHTPPSGTHGDSSSSKEPSPWAKAIASHSRHAAVIAEAAYWMKHKEQISCAYLQDIDQDGDDELILKNGRFFAVFSPSCGGRLVYLFNIDGTRGKMVIGNPCDDWNWMEELNKYMKIPANHPGALADAGHQNDRHGIALLETRGDETRAILVNEEAKSRAFGLKKCLRVARDGCEIEVTYRLPKALPRLTIECGLSPDYLRLLRFGRRNLKGFRNSNLRGYSNGGVSVWVGLDDLRKTVFDEAPPREFGHGYAIRIRARKGPFTVRIGTERTSEPGGNFPRAACRKMSQRVGDKEYE